MKAIARLKVLVPAVVLLAIEFLSTSTLPAQGCDLWVYKWSNIWEIAWVGEPLQYILDYGNYAVPGVDAENVTLEDVLPPGLTYISSDPSGDYDPDSRKVTWNLGTVPLDFSGRITIDTLVDETAGRRLVNEARISTTTPDNDPQNNFTSSEVIVGHAGECDAWVAKWSDPSDEVSPGETHWFLFHYGNGRMPAFALGGGFQGEGYPAENARVVDFLPEGVRYVSSDPPGIYDPGPHTVTWDLGTIAWHGYGNLSIETVVESPVGIALVNFASIGTTNPDLNPENNVTSCSVSVVDPFLNVFVSKWGLQGPCRGGSSATAWILETRGRCLRRGWS